MRHFGPVVAAALSVLVVGACAPAALGAAQRPPAAVAGAGPGAGAGAAASGGWGRAEQVPGLAALTGRGDSGLTAVSCASPGNCSAGGFYASGRTTQAFVVSQASGTWGRALEVPGLAGLNKGGNAQVSTVSCASPGNCSAGGYYTSGHSAGGAPMTAAFVVSQVHGTWGTAQAVPGLAALNTGQQAGVSSVSCASPGECSAGGSFGRPFDHGSCCRANGFVVSQVSGTWGTAQHIQGAAGVSSVSCASPGNCGATAGGLVVSQAGGTWGKAQRVATPAGSSFGKASMTMISCATPGNCTAGGAGQKMARALVASQVRGTWGTAREIPGTAGLTKRGSSQVSAVSCSAAGYCTVGGSGYWQHPEGSSTRAFAVPYVVRQRRGTWGQAERIPAIAAVSKFGYAVITALSCSSSGNCGIAGRYATSSDNPDGSGPGQVFVASQVRGALTTPRVITTALGNDGPAQIAAIACTAAGRCSAVGYYWLREQERAFVISRAG
jgi:hypothetical protein